jgi:protein-S-isoprenylcysteine O-methyltransferase Ste14
LLSGNFNMTRTLAILVWFAGLVVWYIIRYPFERRARKTRVRRSLFDRGDLSILVLTWLGLFVIPAVYALSGFPKSLDRPFIPAVAWIGLVAQCAALWLFRRSHVDLGPNWSVSLQIRERHAVVKAGVYRLIRHPMYSSFFLLGVAQMLLLPNWIAGAAGLLGAGAIFAFRVGREERMMLGSFGDEYRQYMVRTKRLIPWLF